MFPSTILRRRNTDIITIHDVRDPLSIHTPESKTTHPISRVSDLEGITQIRTLKALFGLRSGKGLVVSIHVFDSGCSLDRCTGQICVIRIELGTGGIANTVWLCNRHTRRLTRFFEGCARRSCVWRTQRCVWYPQTDTH